MTSNVVSRLAAANPVPAGPRPDPRPFRLRRVAVALAVLAVAGVPMAAFAGDIGNLLGFTNQGTSLPTSSTPMAQFTGLAQAMQSMDAPSTMHLLGTRDGISFYAARKADGNFCFAISSGDGNGNGFGCTLDDDFPSAARPVLLFPTPVGARIAGFAVDGVASVALLDVSGAPVARATVGNNIFVGDARPDGAATIEALDADGNVIATRPLPG